MHYAQYSTKTRFVPYTPCSWEVIHLLPFLKHSIHSGGAVPSPVSIHFFKGCSPTKTRSKPTIPHTVVLMNFAANFKEYVYVSGFFRFLYGIFVGHYIWLDVWGIIYCNGRNVFCRARSGKCNCSNRFLCDVSVIHSFGFPVVKRVETL